MARSSRQRKQQRAKRRATAIRREAADARRRQWEEALAEAQRRSAQLHDPGTPTETVAALIQQLYAGEPVMPGLAASLVERRASVDEVVRVAEALHVLDADQPDGPSLTVLTFGAHAAHVAGNHARARMLMDKALARADDVALRLRLAGHLSYLGRVADALNLLAAHVDDPAYDADASGRHQDALEVAQRRLEGHGPEGDCPCGSGVQWKECCRPREATAVAAFLDRSGFDTLRSAVADFVATSRYEQPVALGVAGWLDSAAADSWESVDVEPLERLAIEHSWIVARADESSDDEDDNALTAFAAVPGTHPQLAAAALTWRERVRYGLWQVADPRPSPGLSCVDVVTGQHLYAAFAPEQARDLPRWSVLLGAVAPLDGAWRATGAMVRVSPREADALCETIRDAAEVVAGELGGRPARKALARVHRPISFRSAPPNGVYAYLEDEASPLMETLLSRVTAAVLPRLVEEVHTARSAPPTLTNTEGEPLCLVKARLRVQEASRLSDLLADHPDFEVSPDGDQLTWLGLEVPAGQRAAMLAETRAQLHAKGYTDADLADPDRPQRWVRGQVRLRGDEVTVEVNSRRRLDRLIALLGELGAQPTIIDQSQVDPTQDLAWPAGERPVGGGLAPAEEGWERHWLDEPVPALLGRTPRQIAGSDDWPLLEGMMRHMEYDADLLALDGKRGVDTAWLREQLSMPADPYAIRGA